MVVNNVLELHCEASGIPTPSLTWLKDGRPLPQTDSARLIRGQVLIVASAQVGDEVLCCAINLYLIIQKKKKKKKKQHFCIMFYQLEDTGRYSCLASSPAGDDDKEFQVLVHGG